MERHKPQLSLEDRLVMREAEIDILLATVHAERERIKRLRAALMLIAAHEGDGGTAQEALAREGFGC